MILQSLFKLYQRLAEDPSNASTLARWGYSLQDITFRVILNDDGTLLEILDERENKKPIPFLVPGNARQSERSFEPCFLWDDTRFVFGWHGVKQDQKRNLKCFENFKRIHLECESAINDSEFSAVCDFLRQWNPQAAKNQPVLAVAKKGRVVFQISGKTWLVHENQRIREYLKERKIPSTDLSRTGQCLITGQRDCSIARLHLGIKEIPGAPYTGASLVSFNDSAYESFGKSGKDEGRGFNSPTSEFGSFAYATALDWLLSHKKRRFRLIDATTVFWTDEPTEAEEQLPWMLAGVPQAEDEATNKRIRGLLERLARGSMPPDGLGNPSTNYHILGLSLNQGRLSVRFWNTGSLGELLINLKLHFDQLSLVHQWDEASSDSPNSIAPTAYQLLRQTSRDSDGIPPLLSGLLMRSILLGSRYPDALINGVMNRIRVIEKKPNGEGSKEKLSYIRVAILKAWLIRNHSVWLQQKNIKMKKALDTDNPSIAYQLGRLFAVYEQVQRAAHEFKLERTIRETLFSAASATPQSAFGRLDRMNKHHLAKLKLTSNRFYSDLIDEIHQKIFAPTFYPASLNLREQSLFCIGYYHQRHDLLKKNNRNKSQYSIK